MTLPEVALVYTLYGGQEDARAAARGAVEGGFAACANILSPAESFYIWDGALERQAEYPVLFKTDAGRRDRLMRWLEETHPYEVPALLSWAVASATPYARWIADGTTPPQQD